MTWIMVVLVVVSALGLAFFNGVETGVYSLNRLRLRMRVFRGDRHAACIMRLLEDPEGLVASVLVGTNICVYAASALTTELAAGRFHEHAEFVSVAVLTVPLFVFGELVPKDVFRLKADVLGYAAAPALRFFYVIFRPIAGLLAGVARLARARPDASAEAVTREKVAFYFREGAREGPLAGFTGRVLDNVMRFGQKSLRDVMMPAARMVTLSASGDLTDLKRAVARSGFARYPVRDDETGRYLGVVHFFDAMLAGDEGAMLARMVRTVPMIDEAERLAGALRAMRDASAPMALVVNASGEVVGLVTLKDIVEEITGDIAVW